MSESPRSTAAVRKVLALRDHRVEFIALVVAVVGGTYALSYWLSQNYHLSDTDRDMFTLLAKVALGAVFFLATHLYGASGTEKVVVTLLSVFSLLWLVALVIVLVRLHQRISAAGSETPPCVSSPSTFAANQASSGATTRTLTPEEWRRVIAALQWDPRYAAALWARLLADAQLTHADSLDVATGALQRVCQRVGWSDAHGTALDRAVERHVRGKLRLTTAGRWLSYEEFEHRLGSLEWSEKNCWTLWRLLADQNGVGKEAPKLLVTLDALRRACQTWGGRYRRNAAQIERLLGLDDSETLPAPTLSDAGTGSSQSNAEYPPLVTSARNSFRLFSLGSTVKRSPRLVEPVTVPNGEREAAVGHGAATQA